MKLSVIIVNYNVEYFLEQCLHSVLSALKGIDGEIFVVDNHSVDGSVEMVRKKFPEVKLIINNTNPGFSKANNQAIRECKGEYILLLNPDTVVQEDTFQVCIRFMEEKPDCGACGVMLIDGKGNYLPESKRSIPTPEVAFYKIFGLSLLFPKSKRFGRYHLGYLDKNQTHEVDVLSGAFMFIRKSALNQTGLLDENFFMYGEDIDLSYRIKKAGFRIYYHPGTRIIHYRGESTKKGSINYVIVFYQAMIIFANKHFSNEKARLFSMLIRLAVYLRAGMAIVKRAISGALLPLADSILLFSGLTILKNYWSAHTGVYYPYEFQWVVMPTYCILWMFGIWIFGGYEKPYRIGVTSRGIIASTIFILVIYGLLDEQHRYSRFLTLVGAGWAVIASGSMRLLSNIILYRNMTGKNPPKRILVIGKMDEATRIIALLNQSMVRFSYLGIVNPLENDEINEGFTGNINRLKEMVEIFGINELIFCGRDISSTQIMDQMMQINHPEIEYKIAPPESLFIIGSNSIDGSGELYTVGLNSIDKPENKRKKRIFDMVVSVLLLILSPILSIFLKNRFQFFLNMAYIIFGKLSLVGYSSKAINMLPPIRKGVLTALDHFTTGQVDIETIKQSDILYAKDYRVSHDFEILWSAWKKLGRKVN